MVNQESDKENQKKELKEKLQKAKDNIDKNVDLNITEQNKQYESKNSALNELINIQTTLSDGDRIRILQAYNKDKLYDQNSIVNCFLKQRQKIVEALVIKKTRKLKESKEKHNEKVEALFERKMKSRSHKTEQEIKNECQTFLMVDYVRDQLKAVASAENKNDIDGLIENVRRELLAERVDFFNKIEENSVASILQGQMLKAKEVVNLKDEEEKLLKFQLAAIESNINIPNSREMFDTYYKCKDGLQEQIITGKISQERSFKKTLESRGRKSLLKNSDRENKQPDKLILKQNEQNFKDQVLKKEIESERLIQTVERDLLKKLLSPSNIQRDAVKNVLLEIYPTKINQEIDNLLEEIYPKSKSQPVKENQTDEKSLIKVYRKYSETNTQKDIKKSPDPNLDAQKTSNQVITDNPLTPVEPPIKDELNSFDKPDTVKEIKSPEEKVEKEKSRTKKRKIRRKTLNEDEALVEDI